MDLYSGLSVSTVNGGVWLSLARAPGLGPGGRRFESCHPDIFYIYKPDGSGGGKSCGELAHPQLFLISDTCGDSRKARKIADFSSVPGGNPVFQVHLLFSGRLCFRVGYGKMGGDLRIHDKNSVGILL